MGHSTDWYRKQRKLAKQGDANAIASMSKKHNKDTSVNSRKEQIKKRVESKQKSREYEKKNGHKASSKGLDYDHATNRYVSVKKNRGRKGEGNR